MSRRRPGGPPLAAPLAALVLSLMNPADARAVGEARLEPVSFRDLEAWAADDHAAA